MVFKDLPIDTHSFTSVMISYRPKPEGSFSYYDSIANHRLKRMEEEYFAPYLKNEIINRNTGGDGNRETLPPKSYISHIEMFTVQLLTAIFCLDVLEDKTLTNGLEIKEIIRGYCVLHKFAYALQSSSDSPGLVCKIFTFDELKDLFLKNGLSKQSSEKFISLMTFKISSPDVFDAPLLKTAEGKYALFLPALLFGSPPMIIASILSSHSEFSQKGGSFENDMLQFFKENGLHAQRAKFTRDNECYEYDIVLEWDDHVFIIECKNY